MGVSQTLQHSTEGVIYIRQGGHHVGHWPTFLLFYCSILYTLWWMKLVRRKHGLSDICLWHIYYGYDILLIYTDFFHDITVCCFNYTLLRGNWTNCVIGRSLVRCWSAWDGRWTPVEGRKKFRWEIRRTSGQTVLVSDRVSVICRDERSVQSELVHQQQQQQQQQQRQQQRQRQRRQPVEQRQWTTS